MMPASQLTAETIARGEVICDHELTDRQEISSGYDRDSRGHMERLLIQAYCTKCNKLVDIGVEYGSYKTHDWEWQCIEDMQNGLYMFDVWCTTCGYSDTAMSDDPRTPKL